MKVWCVFAATSIVKDATLDSIWAAEVEAHQIAHRLQDDGYETYVEPYEVRHNDGQEGQ